MADQIQNPVPSLSWFLTQATPLFTDNFLVTIKTLFEGLNLELASEIVRWSFSLSNGSQILGPVTYVTCNTTDYGWRNGSLWELQPVAIDENVPGPNILSQ